MRDLARERDLASERLGERETSKEGKLAYLPRQLAHSHVTQKRRGQTRLSPSTISPLTSAGAFVMSRTTRYPAAASSASSGSSSCIPNPTHVPSPPISSSSEGGGDPTMPAKPNKNQRRKRVGERSSRIASRPNPNPPPPLFPPPSFPPMLFAQWRSKKQREA